MHMSAWTQSNSSYGLVSLGQVYLDTHPCIIPYLYIIMRVQYKLAQSSVSALDSTSLSSTQSLLLITESPNALMQVSVIIDIVNTKLNNTVINNF